MFVKIKKLLSSLVGFTENVTKLQQFSGNTVTLYNVLHSQAGFIRANYDVTDLNNPLIDIMKCHQGIWLPLEESRFPLWMENGEYQKSNYDAALKYVKNYDVAIDAGANVGFFAKNMGNDFQSVHCFEPVWFVRSCLVRNVKSNGVIIYPFGLSDDNTEVEISTSTIACGGGQIGGTEGLEEQFPVKEIVRLITLDSLNIPPIDFIKIDVQGFEMQTLRGAQETLKRSNAVILCELVLNNKEDLDITAFLESIGYHLVERLGKDGIFTK